MHTVDLLEEACLVAKRLGFRLRQAWLDGSGGGPCEIAGQPWIFIDLAQNSIEQLGMLVETLRDDPRLAQLSLSPKLGQLLRVAPQRQRRAA